PEGHVSRWTLLVSNRSITVSCTAEQTLPVGISFEASSTVTQAFSCTEIQMPTGLAGFMQYVAASLIGAFVTALVASAAVGLAIRLAGPSRGVPDSDCSYLTVRPPAAKPATEHPDDRSDCTEFLEIVADGD
uniref:Glycoprotein E n=1 Tax=Macrostomum lignano TaxID=282301 RepID=A0A1I8H7N5_9PLAT